MSQVYLASLDLLFAKVAVIALEATIGTLRNSPGSPTPGGGRVSTVVPPLCRAGWLSAAGPSLPRGGGWRRLVAMVCLRDKADDLPSLRADEEVAR
jgi:hypothetical protein